MPYDNYGWWERENAECISKMDAKLDQMHLVQLAMSMLCFCQLVFMTSRFPKQAWEAMYLPAAECVLYAMAASGNGYLRLANGRLLPWARMASWLATCPVMLNQINTISPLKLYGINLNNLQIALSIVRVVNGVSASSVDDDSLKWGFFFMGFFCLVIEFSIAYNIFALGLAKFKEAGKDSDICARACDRLQVLRGIFFSAWTMFPVIWLFSPQGTCLLGEDVIPLLYLFADLVCKNCYGILWYDTTWRLLDGKGWNPELQLTDNEVEELVHAKEEVEDHHHPHDAPPKDGLYVPVQPVGSEPAESDGSAGVVPPLRLHEMNLPYTNSPGQLAQPPMSPRRSPRSRAGDAPVESIITIGGREYVLANPANHPRATPRTTPRTNAALWSPRTTASKTPRSRRHSRDMGAHDFGREVMLVQPVEAVPHEQLSARGRNGSEAMKLSSSMVWSHHTPRGARAVSPAMVPAGYTERRGHSRSLSRTPQQQYAEPFVEGDSDMESEQNYHLAMQGQPYPQHPQQQQYQQQQQQQIYPRPPKKHSQSFRVTDSQYSQSMPGPVMAAAAAAAELPRGQDSQPMFVPGLHDSEQQAQQQQDDITPRTMQAMARRADAINDYRHPPEADSVLSA